MVEDYSKGTFTDYKNEVLRVYQDNETIKGLEDPKPKKLREYSLYILANRHSKEDEQMLKLFFDPDNDHGDLEKGIRAFDLDKFKPLIAFMLGRTTKTEDKNVKLLAWLIGFESYERWRAHRRNSNSLVSLSTMENKDNFSEPTLASDKVKRNVSEPEVEIGIKKRDNEEEKAAIKRPLKNGDKKWIVYIIAVAAIAGVIFLVWEWRRPKCMYWAGDHYQPISCDKKIEGAMIIALDKDKVAHLKKIAHPDTITRNALGKVWYVKTNGKLEFYTDSGALPTDPLRKLMPMTEYIFEKYVEGKP